jgi:uncharacterized protein
MTTSASPLIVPSLTAALIAACGQAASSERTASAHARAAVPGAPAAELRAGANRVSFDSDGETLVGQLYLPPDYRPGRRLPGVVVVGSLTAVKEQMSGLYAARLAARGFAALAFDYRNFGQSSGEPRQYESPAQHIADIRNAVSFLHTVPAVDADRIGGLGVCTGGAYMGVAAASDARIKAYAGVALHVSSADSNLVLYGGADGVRQRREAGHRAMAAYREHGRVDYLRAYSNRPGDATASHSGPMEYYFDASRGAIRPWTNRFAVMSWEEWLDFEPLAAAARIRVPSLVIHSDQAALPDNARAFYQRISAADKRLIWTDLPHFDYYDRDASRTAAAQVAAHFEAALAR